MSAVPTGRRVPYVKSVHKSDVFEPLGLALSEKQIPQATEKTEKSKLVDGTVGRNRNGENIVLGNVTGRTSSAAWSDRLTSTASVKPATLSSTYE